MRDGNGERSLCGRFIWLDKFDKIRRQEGLTHEITQDRKTRDLLQYEIASGVGQAKARENPRST